LATVLQGYYSVTGFIQSKEGTKIILTADENYIEL
jgi:hypothetical protein